MSKNLNDLIQGRHLPKETIKRMERTEPGMLSAALGAMVYARSHDEKMRSMYPEKVFVGADVGSDYMREKLGFDGPYMKSDAAVARVIDLLDALALQYALENR